MKTFLHILYRILTEKYPDIDFEFYLSSHSKNVHLSLNCNILSLSDHDSIIANIEKIWTVNLYLQCHIYFTQLGGSTVIFVLEKNDVY